jgi:hypothetical protein
MFIELQFIAVAAFLLWGLASAVCDWLLTDDSYAHLLHVDNSAGRTDAENS